MDQTAHEKWYIFGDRNEFTTDDKIVFEVPKGDELSRYKASVHTVDFCEDTFHEEFTYVVIKNTETEEIFASARLRYGYNAEDLKGSVFITGEGEQTSTAADLDYTYHPTKLPLFHLSGQPDFLKEIDEIIGYYEVSTITSLQQEAISSISDAFNAGALSKEQIEQIEQIPEDVSKSPPVESASFIPASEVQNTIAPTESLETTSMKL